MLAHPGTAVQHFRHAPLHQPGPEPYDVPMATFTVTRNAYIPVPAGRIFPLVNDFKKWTQWSPWETVDPNLQRDYFGSDSGVGAKYAWSGNAKAGSGLMEIVSSEEPSRINIRLEFLKPMKATNPTEFTFTPEGEGTRVTWTMNGENKTLMSKLFALVMNMDKLVGTDFEKGLAALGAAAAKNQG